MNNNDLKINIEPFLLTRVRMQSARLGIPASKPPRDQQLDYWLDSLPLIPTMSEDSGIDYEVSLTGDRTRLTWRASGKPKDFIPVMSDYWQEVGASSVEMERLKEIGSNLLPPILGSWIEVTELGLDTGWYFPLEIPLDEALEIAPSSNKNDLVSDWAEEFNLDICDRLSSTLAEGYPYTELQVPLLRNNIEQQIEIALELFTLLKIPHLPDLALGALLNLPSDELSITLRLTPTGVSKLGILANVPNNMLVIDLCRIANIQDIESIAAFQGLLDVEQPTQIECQQRAEGFTIEMHYLGLVENLYKETF
jgi:hypothetical protein